MGRKHPRSPPCQSGSCLPPKFTFSNFINISGSTTRIISRLGTALSASGGIVFLSLSLSEGARGPPGDGKVAALLLLQPLLFLGEEEDLPAAHSCWSQGCSSATSGASNKIGFVVLLTPGF